MGSRQLSEGAGCYHGAARLSQCRPMFFRESHCRWPAILRERRPVNSGRGTNAPREPRLCIVRLDRDARIGASAPAAVRANLEARLVDWRALLQRNVVQGRQILSKLLVGPLTCAPRGDAYEIRGVGTIGKLLSGVVRMVASPTGFEPVF